MNRKLFLGLILVALFTWGCSIIPKPVEFGQHKVKEFPQPSATLTETQRQAAELAAQKARETFDAATAEDATALVTEPAKDTADLTQVVSTSLGPPSSRWDGETQALVRKLEHQIAALNAKVDKFAKRNDEDAGKKIEGTGWFQVPYFVWLGIVVAVIAIVHLVLKAVANAAAAANPGVAGALTVARLGSSFLKSGFSTIAQDAKALEAKLAPEVKAEYAALQAKLEQLIANHDTLHNLTKEQ